MRNGGKWFLPVATSITLVIERKGKLAGALCMQWRTARIKAITSKTVKGSFFWNRFNHPEERYVPLFMYLSFRKYSLYLREAL